MALALRRHFFRKQHADAVLPRIDAQNRERRDPNLHCNAAKPCAKADLIVFEYQILYGRRAEVEYDLAVPHELPGHHYTRYGRIDQQVRRQAVVQDPVIERTDQVRPI